MKKNFYEKIGVTNPARFWTGVTMIGAEILFLYSIYLASLNWSWLTKELAMVVSGIALIIGYNVFAGRLILKGSK